MTLSPEVSQSELPRRRATNVTLPTDLVRNARAMGLNISEACEHGLAAAVAAARRQQWLAENQRAMTDWNIYVEANGLPLERYRQF